MCNQKMSLETIKQCLKVIDTCQTIKTIDLTWDAPEMHPNFKWFLNQLVKILKTLQTNYHTLLH